MDHVLLVLAGAFVGFLAGFGLAALMMASKCGDCKAERIAERERIQRLWF